VIFHLQQIHTYHFSASASDQRIYLLLSSFIARFAENEDLEVALWSQERLIE
jgi:hypothetical protein